MKGKLMMGAACLALLLGSCVKDDESQSVTNIRDAKTEQLKSVAALNNATAEATKVLAEADAALKLAEAEAKKAEAALTAAEAKLKEAEAALKEVEVEAARAELEALKAKYEAEVAYYEGEKAKHLAALEKAAVDAERALINAQNLLEQAKEAYRNSLEGIESREAAKLVTLYNAYADAARNVISAKNTLTAYQVELAKAEANLVSAQESIEDLLAVYDEWIVYYEESIAKTEAAIEIIKEYATEVDLEKVKADYDAAWAAAYEADEAYVVAEAAYNKVDAEKTAINNEIRNAETYYNNPNWTFSYSGDKSEYALMLKNEAYYDSNINNRGYDNILQSDERYFTKWDSNRGCEVANYNSPRRQISGLVEKYVRLEGFNYNTNVWGYEVEDDLTGSKFIPLFGYVTKYKDTEYIEYELEGAVHPNQKYPYSEVESIGYVDEAAIAGYLEWLAAGKAENSAKNLENAQKAYDEAVEAEAQWKGIVEAALARKEANDAWTEAKTALDDANDALSEANDAVTAAEDAITTAKSNVATKKAAVEGFTAKTTGSIAVQTAVVEGYTKKETGKVAVAEAALAAAKKAQSELKATATAAEKAAAAQAVADAEATLAQVKKELAAEQEKLADIKKQAEWAAEDLKAAEAKLEAAEAELEAAEAAIPALETAVVAAQNAADDAKRAYEVATNNYNDVCEAANVTPQANADTAYTAAVNSYNSKISDTQSRLDTLNRMKDNSTEEGIEKQVANAKNFFTRLFECKAVVDELLEEYNAKEKTRAEAGVALNIASHNYEIAYAEYVALGEVYYDAEEAAERIPNLLKNIEYYKAQIELYEEAKVEAVEFTDLKQTIEKWKLEVALAEQLVKVREAEEAAAKAAYEAAIATPEE